MTLAAMTKLEAVNSLLSTVGQATISSYPSAQPTRDETTAGAILDDMTRKLQMGRSWFWNYAETRTLTADGSGNYVLPTVNSSIAHKVEYPDDDSASQDPSADRISERAGKVYNETDETFNFTAGSTRAFKLTYLVDFADLPEVAKWWIVQAGRVRMLTSRLANPASIAMARTDEHDALVLLEGEQNRRRKPNLFNEWTAARPINRNAPLSSGQIAL